MAALLGTNTSESSSMSSLQPDENTTNDMTSTLMSNHTTIAPDLDGNDVNILMIVLLVIGGIVLCGLVVVCIVLWRRRRISSHYGEVPTADAEPKGPNEYEETSETEASQRVPVEPEKPITGEEVEKFIHHLTGRHCWRLVDTLGPETFGTLEKSTEDIIDENREALFDAKKMLLDWLKEQNCSDNEKRRMLYDNVKKIGRGTLEDYTWIGDDELDQIIENLDPPMTKQLCETLGVECVKSDDEEEEQRESVLKTVRKWRDGKTSSVTDRIRYKRFLSALKGLNVSMAATVLKTELVALEKDELVSMAFQLFMQDLRPFAAALGIDETKTNQYRQQLVGNRAEKGTISLLEELCKKEENDRDRVCRALKSVGYFNVAKMVVFGNYGVD